MRKNNFTDVNTADVRYITVEYNTPTLWLDYKPINPRGYHFINITNFILDKTPRSHLSQVGLELASYSLIQLLTDSKWSHKNESFISSMPTVAETIHSRQIEQYTFIEATPERVFHPGWGY